MGRRTPGPSFTLRQILASQLFVGSIIHQTCYCNTISIFDKPRVLNSRLLNLLQISWMAATCDGSGGYPPEIIGYTEPWIVAPGDTIAVKVRIPLFLSTPSLVSRGQIRSLSQRRAS